LAGGLSVAAWGVVRATEDLDFIELPRKLGGLSADILWAYKHWHRDTLMRTIAVTISRRRLRLLHPEYLFLLKLDAGGPQDLIDVAGLLASPPSPLNLLQLQETARRQRLGRLLAQCLNAAGSKEQLVVG